MSYQGNLKATKVTLYFQGSGLLGSVVKVEAREAQVLRRQWAQYPGAVDCRFVKPRCRRWSLYTEGYRPYLVVLEGWGHPEPQSPWETVSEEPGVTVQKARHSFCSDEWFSDFDGWLAAYLAAHPSVKVLGDYRHTAGCSGYDKGATNEYDAQQAESVREQLVAAGVDDDVATEAALTYVAHGPYMAASYLCNDNDVGCSVGAGHRRSASALHLADGVIVEPEDFFEAA